jgi:transposase
MWSLAMCLYVRNLRIDEGRKLQNIIRRGRDRIVVRRAQIILASNQGSKVPDIARRFYFSEQHVRTIIKEFNTDGFDALSPKYAGGRPPKFSEEQRSLIIETALCPPDLLGRPFRRWSLAKLREFIIAERIVESIGIETLRQMLKGAKVRLRRTKTWKECNDPALKSKKK